MVLDGIGEWTRFLVLLFQPLQSQRYGNVGHWRVDLVHQPLLNVKQKYRASET